ncbi:hypothetical protein [Actinoplanes sp. L3-i22]|uniref:hypothetical protein n=1 Tax=Actinoplanes sp. L3-i22 TaxID=2836373 RepID=UPI001C765A5E|nr:hypothetical protein [Actinoplanes sp. L3-i22]BCY07150.1 DNA-binding protein [Actinoplanes sp. L3-i22]
MTTTEVITARAYRHPVLDGRTVVRLVGATVGPAEDLTMEFLGFTPAGVTDVGHGERQALGFPAWALVHDPANGRHALALVKEMAKLARVARGKPGNAKDGYTELARRLDAAAPQFLPTFWEEAGRAFLAAENSRMAGTCFTEARRAEQVHGLVVDEARVRDVHLEFAFGGGLTATMLAAYSREVVERRPAPEAYELVKTLALRRVAGGLAPHATMAADLARLAKAAGLDAGHEADEVVTQLLGYPAMGRAHPAVWKAYRASLIRLGKRDAGVRARLLEIIPDPPGWDTGFVELWLELLTASGAADGLTAPDGPAAGWLERFVRGRRFGPSIGRNPRLLALLERMTPRLIAQGGVSIADQPWNADLDILDLLRAGGVPVRIGTGHPANGFGVAAWARGDRPGRRDLAAIAADPELRPRLRLGVRQAIGYLRDGLALTSPALPDETLAAAFGAAGSRELLVEIIGELTGQAGANAVAGLDADLTELAALWSPAGMALAPDGFRALLDVDLPAVLARTLRAGQMAELTWPAYEAAIGRLSKHEVGVAWPELVLHDDKAAQVIAPDGRVTEHVFRFPAAGQQHAPGRYWNRIGVASVDGELLVHWYGDDGQAGYWSSRPDEVTDGEWRMTNWPVLPVPGGGLTNGRRPLHRGDRKVSWDEFVQLASDGPAFWRREPVDPDAGWAERTWHWREFDPRTGDGGRVSAPAFFAAAGDDLLPELCQLRPVPAEFAGSPLGVRDGLAGWRVTRAPDGTITGEGVDGRRVVVGADHELVVGAVLLPGATAPLPISRHQGRGPAHDQLRIWSADGARLVALQGQTTSTVPPLDWWHAMRTRDAAGSAALRALDEATAAALLVVDDAVTSSPALREAITANLVTHLPAVTDPVLRDRLAEVVMSAVRMRRRLAEIPRHLGGSPAAVRERPPANDDDLRRAIDGLAGRESGWGYSAAPRFQILEQIAGVGALLAAPDGVSHADLPAVHGTWPGLLARLGAVALRAASPLTGDTDRTALAAFLAAVAGTPLDGSGPPLRTLEVGQARSDGTGLFVHRDGPRVTVLFPPERNYYVLGPDKWRRAAIQIAPDGDFGLPEGLTVESEARSGGRLAGARLTAFLDRLAERGPAPWRPEAVTGLTAATGMSRAEAAMLLAGLPAIHKWEANFLTAAQRGTLGLNAAQAKVGRAALQRLGFAERMTLLDAALPAEPADLWDHGPDVAGLAAAWIRIRGRRVAVPETLVAELARVINGAQAASVLQAIAAPTAGDWLSTDGRSTHDRYRTLTTKAAEGTAFDAVHLQLAAIALPWLAYHLPWGDPLRAALPAALGLVRERLRNPHLLVGRGRHKQGERPDAGPALVDGDSYGDDTAHHLVPAHLTGADDPALGFVDQGTAAALRVVLSGWIDEALAAPAGVTGDPHDPRVSVPELVAEVRERHGLTDDAAAYYLQLLALPDPGDRAVQGWNGWKPAALRTAQQALTGAGLVVAAKRERAGRPVFLPGGWQANKPPRPPMETWKESLYLDNGHLPVVTRSVPRLFAAAWDRITAGDVPRYLDLGENSR